MQNSTKECPVCKSMASCFPDYQHDNVFYDCPVCGRYELTVSGYSIQDDNRLASYLYYNRFRSDNYSEYRYHTTLCEEQCDEYRKEFDNGNNSCGRPVHMDSNIVENWYPKSFYQRTDQILIHLSKKAIHIGQSVELNNAEILSLLFVDRKEIEPHSKKAEWREESACLAEAGYMLDFLKSEKYIITDARSDYVPPSVVLTLTPKGYSRVDSIQKALSYGNNALVAMKFGDDTKLLRESIRKGIQKSGFNAVFIDEVQHNDFITPELLNYIRGSKFVVVDLTHQNNGAYFEEGYAMGLGKPVIQLCQQDTKLHFDIAQKNTIIWNTEDDIPERLCNRIKATID